MSLRLRNVQLDVPSGPYDATVEFWAGALGASTRDADGPFTHLVGPASSFGVHLQRLETGTARIHVDLGADDRAAAAARLVELGADDRGDGAGGPVVADPAGLALCVCGPGEGAEELAPPPEGRAHLRLLVVDVPRDEFDDVLGFWGAAFGGEARRLGEPWPAYAQLRGVPGPDGPVDLLFQAIDEGEARFHLDLHGADVPTRDAEVTRLCELGATEVARVDHWVTLADPAGLLLCVVPDRRDDQ